MKFRGITKKGEWVEGYHYYNPFVKQHSILWAVKFSTFDIKDIIPESLAMSTTQLDKNKKEIFGSIPLEDGSMSKGGDRIVNPSRNNGKPHIVVFNQGRFVGKYGLLEYDLYQELKEIEVIGNQMDFETGKEK